MGGFVLHTDRLYRDGAGAPRPAPALGADTAGVLSGLLGLSATEVRDLTERQVVGAEQKGRECDA